MVQELICLADGKGRKRMKWMFARPPLGRYNTRFGVHLPAKPPVDMVTRATMETDLLVSQLIPSLALPFAPSPPICTEMRTTMMTIITLLSWRSGTEGYYSRSVGRLAVEAGQISEKMLAPSVPGTVLERRGVSTL